MSSQEGAGRAAGGGGGGEGEGGAREGRRAPARFAPKVPEARKRRRSVSASSALLSPPVPPPPPCPPPSTPPASLPLAPPPSPPLRCCVCHSASSDAADGCCADCRLSLIDSDVASPLVEQSSASTFPSSASTFVSRARGCGSVGLGATQQRWGGTGAAPSAATRQLLGRRAVSARMAAFAVQLGLAHSPSSPLQLSALQLLEKAVEERFGDGRSRWMEVASMAALYIAHRQMTQQRPPPSPLALSLSSSSSPSAFTAASARPSPTLGSMCALLQVPPSVLLQVMRRVAEMAQVRPMQQMIGAEYIDQALGAVTWKDQRGGAGGEDGEDVGMRGRRQLVRAKVQQLLEVGRLRSLLAGHSPSALCGAAVSLVLHCHPYVAYHTHGAGAALHRTISTATQHSPRTIAHAQRVLTRQLIDLSPLTAAPCTSDNSLATPFPPLSLSLVLDQLDLLLHCCPRASPSALPPSSISVTVTCTSDSNDDGWGDGEEGEVVVRQRAAQVDLSDYIRTEEEVEDMRRITGDIDRRHTVEAVEAS